MRILLIVGSANDIFISSMSKWLKRSIKDLTIDIFEFYPTSSQEENIFADSVHSLPKNVWHQKIPKFRTWVHPYFASRSLQLFLRDKTYDIIHCHWIVPPLVLTPNIRQHCKTLYATFWGREWAMFSILGSNKLYKKHLDCFINEVDFIINSKSFKNTLLSLYPNHVSKHIEGYLGSEPLEELYELMRIENKCNSKDILSIDNSKFTVLIGYSGKSLHQHLAIIDQLSQMPSLKNKLHILAPMTRGAELSYCDEVQSALVKSGYSFTLLRDRFLSNIEVARLRNATDITLQLSTSDGFSRSILECLCAKSILIYGDWLNYDEHLNNANLKAHPVSSIKHGVEKINDIIQNMSQYQEEVELNSIHGKHRNIWSECITAWVNAYINNR